MDSKRHASEVELRQVAEQAMQAIQQCKPAVIIASDDNAVKYVIVPHFKDGPLPVCGVNWSAAQYGLPTASVTGMLEVVPIVETLTTLRQYYPRLKKPFVLLEESVSEESNRRALEPLYRELGLAVDYAYVKDYAAWKRQFARAQRQADLIYLPTNGAIKGWDDADARVFIKQTIRKSVVTCDDFMMPYAVFGLTKVAREQGEWAARAALDLLAGLRPANGATQTRGEKRPPP
jgi:ABC-type uncharacterized transport system substrate-binding protein